MFCFNVEYPEQYKESLKYDEKLGKHLKDVYVMSHDPNVSNLLLVSLLKPCSRSKKTHIVACSSVALLKGFGGKPPMTCGLIVEIEAKSSSILMYYFWVRQEFFLD